MSNTRETINFLTSSNPPDTPWGPALAKTALAEGIDLYITQRHGGYKLSPERIAKMPHPLGHLGTFHGYGWYERDNDASLVVFSFPELFTDYEVFVAVETILQQCPIYLKGVDVWLETFVAKGLRDRCDSFYAGNSTKFRVIGMVPHSETSWHCQAATLDRKQAALFTIANPTVLPSMFTIDDLIDAGAKILRTATPESIPNPNETHAS